MFIIQMVTVIVFVLDKTLTCLLTLPVLRSREVNHILSKTVKRPSVIDYPQCGSEDYQCDNGQCISNIQHCDLVPDCADASDESLCGKNISVASSRAVVLS